MSDLFRMAEELTHPVVVAACQRMAPKGFRPFRQLRHIFNKPIARIKKQYGAKNVHVESGHFDLYLTKRIASKDKKQEHFEAGFVKDGCMIFVREEAILAGQKPKRRLLPGTNIEAGEPDWTKECACGGNPIEPTTGKCGVCLWGEFAMEGGKW